MLRINADVPAVAAYLEYRRWNDHIKSHGEKLLEHLNPATGRFHPRFTIAAARTGRMSASSPNVQGLPREREFRALFVPRPGNVFVRADYNQMQLRIAALLSGDARLLGAFTSGETMCTALPPRGCWAKKPSTARPQHHADHHPLRPPRAGGTPPSLRAGRIAAGEYRHGGLSATATGLSLLPRVPRLWGTRCFFLLRISKPTSRSSQVSENTRMCRGRT